MFQMFQMFFLTPRCRHDHLMVRKIICDFS